MDTLSKPTLVVLGLIVLVGGYLFISGKGQAPEKEVAEENVVCAQDVKVCTDGSFVSRQAPSCAFPACPEEIHTEDMTGHTEEEMAQTAPVKENSTAGTEEEKEARVIVVTGKDFAYSLDEIRVKEGEKIRIEFTSTSGFHDWVVDELDAATARVNTGGKTSVEFVASKKGTFEYYCSVGSHRTLGMRGNLIVE